MFCRYCGVKIPEDSRFCPQCGKNLAVTDPPEAQEVSEVAENAPASHETKVFTFPPKTTFDQASLPVIQWLKEHSVDLKDLRCNADAILLAGTLVPILERLELDYVESEDSRPYQLGVMIDSRNDFGLSRKKSGTALNKQFEQWHKEHPEYQVDCKVDQPLSLGWCSGSLTLFCYR